MTGGKEKKEEKKISTLQREQAESKNSLKNSRGREHYHPSMYLMGADAAAAIFSFVLPLDFCHVIGRTRLSFW